MITTKAYVTEVPEEGSNIYRVRVPLMEDNTETEAEFNAIVASSAGIYKGIEKGDCVIVDFEDDKYDTAIILGKLFVEVPQSTSAVGIFNQLEVTGSVVLPNDTKIGNYTPQDLFNLYQGVEFNEGGGTGTLNPDDLKQYVQWTVTEREDPTEGNIDVYADHIRVMTGEEYEALLSEDNEDFDEELFNHTLYFLSSLPGEAPEPVIVATVQDLNALLAYNTSGLNNGDIVEVLYDEHYGNRKTYYRWNASSSIWQNTTDGWSPNEEDSSEWEGDSQQFDPPAEEQYSFQALANEMNRRLNTTIDYSQDGVSLHTKKQLSIDLISVSINTLLKNDKTGGSYYVYFAHFITLDSNGWDLFYTYLPNNPPASAGAGNWLGTDWENFTSEEPLRIGDIVTFIDQDGVATYAAVYAGNNEYYGGNYIVNKNSAKCVKLTKEEITACVPTDDFIITRITQSLIDRHTGSPINTNPVRYSVSIKISPAYTATVEGVGWYEANSTATLKIIPNSGYSFDSWFGGSLSNPLTVTVTENAVYHAYLSESDDDPFVYDIKVPMPNSNELDFLYTADIHCAWRNFGLYKGATSGNGKGNAKTGEVSVFSLGSDGSIKRTAGCYSSDASFSGDLPGDLATYQQKLITANIPTFLLDCGDFSQAGFGETNNEKRYTIQRIKELNYLAVTIGNHEWNWPSSGKWNVATAISEWEDANIVCCNLFYKANNVWTQRFTPYKTLKIGNKKVAIIGIACPSFYEKSTSAGDMGSIQNYYNSNTSAPINPVNGVDVGGHGYWYYERWYDIGDEDGWSINKNYIMLDSINNQTKQENGTATDSCLYRLVQSYIDDLKNNHGFDYIIAIFHMTDSSYESYSGSSKVGFTRADYLIKNTSGLDVVIPGHYNKSLFPNGSGGYQNKIVQDKSGRNVMIAAEAGACMQSIGRLRLNLDNDQITCNLLTKIEDLNSI